MGVLGKLPGTLLIHFGTVVILGTIVLCYIIAVTDGHVKAWLPTISECGEHPPEQYFFRYGVLTGGLLLVVLALYIYAADFSFSRNEINLSMGVVAGVSLGVVAVCAANENNLVHTSQSRKPSRCTFVLYVPSFCMQRLRSSSLFWKIFSWLG